MIVEALILLVVINCAIRLSFRRLWQSVLFGAICGAFVVAACPLATQQSRTELAALMADRARMQDLAVAVTIEGTICLSCCFLHFKRMRTGRLSRWGRALDCYPSLLIFSALFVCLAQAIYALPGISFEATAWGLAVGVILAMPLTGLAIRRLLPAEELRMEVHFLLSLAVCAMGLGVTVDSEVTYAAAEQPVDLRAVVIFTAAVVTLFLIGRWLNKRKWRNKKTLWK